MLRTWILSLLLLIGYAGFAQISLSPIDTLVPTRDGEELAVDLYLPDGPGPFPTILIQTPYWRVPFRLIGLPLGIEKDIEDSPYAFAIADWRCFYGSIDACTLLPMRGADGYDLVEWIAAQAWSNGKVGTLGPSALGDIQFQTAREAPPHPTGPLRFARRLRAKFPALDHRTLSWESVILRHASKA